MSAHVLLVDNYDSFTYNLVQLLQVEGADVTVLRNDRVEPADIERLEATHLVVSPGPGRPLNAGNSVAMIRAASGRIPVLGVCLGHQAIAHAAGLDIGAAKCLMHGKTSQIHHDGRGVFDGLPNPFEAGRYHSLAIVDPRVAERLEVTAWTDDGEVMGVRDRNKPLAGVQFHPESILTPLGARLLSNFLTLTIPDPAHSAPPVRGASAGTEGGVQ